MNRSIFAILAIGMVCACSETPPKYAWEIVGSQGITQFVYLEPAALNDNNFMSRLIADLSNDGAQHMELYFFDAKYETPMSFPMSDSQMLHWRATYRNNPNNGFREYVLITVMDSLSSPPKLEQNNRSLPF